ncbi:MAG: glycosyltransferase, partial [Terriglobales bacterium]
NLEAMACETAVVASATGGIKEVVVPGETGILVPLEQDPETNAPLRPEQFARDLAAGIAKVLASPDLQRAYGQAGRARVEAVFSWRAIAEQTAALYAQLHAGRGKIVSDAARS